MHSRATTSKRQMRNVNLQNTNTVGFFKYFQPEDIHFDLQNNIISKDLALSTKCRLINIQTKLIEAGVIVNNEIIAGLVRNPRLIGLLESIFENNLQLPTPITLLFDLAYENKMRSEINDHAAIKIRDKQTSTLDWHVQRRQHYLEKLRPSKSLHALNTNTQKSVFNSNRMNQ